MLRRLLYEYKKTLMDVRKAYRETETITIPEQREKEKAIISSMISDLEFAIEWIEHGRQPGKMRGADKTKVYIKDPKIMDSSLKYTQTLVIPAESERELNREEKEMLEDALCTLTKREKEVFLLIKAEGLTFEYTAFLLNIRKTTVQTHLKRAQQKIERKKYESIFLVAFNI